MAVFKYFLLSLFIILPLKAIAQTALYEDTIRISEVVISGRKVNSAEPGYKIISADSALLRYYNKGTLAEMMSGYLPVMVKTYGMGGSATPSFRGTGASQTLVVWNGLKIDHPMLGQGDLSLYPAGMTDAVDLLFGSASMPVYSGASGGIISMETKPVWKKSTEIEFDPSMGSFGRYSGLLNVRTGNSNFHSSTRVFKQAAENNFKYINRVSGPEPFSDYRENSQFSQNGVLQELYYRHSGKTLSGRVWYNSTLRNLASSLLVSSAGEGEKQKDESLRVMIDFENDLHPSDYYIKGAMMMNRLNYDNRIASVHSRNYSETWVLQSGFKGKFTSKTEYQIAINEEFNRVISNNYESDKSRNSINASFLLRTVNTGRISGSLLFREILDRNKFLIPDFSAGLEYKLSESNQHNIKANFSRSSRVPSLNDLFWSPGGNSDLKNEYAFVYELGYKMMKNIGDAIDLNLEVTGFKNHINDMIQWTPGTFNYWTAANIKNVSTGGIETSAEFVYRVDPVVFRFYAGYYYTRATNEKVESEKEVHRDQLIYVPVHKANAFIHAGWKELSFIWKSDFTGKRYITADNKGFLPSYFINSCSAGIKHPTSFGFLGLNIDVENIFNIEYQTIPYYPLPGRYWDLRLFIQLKYDK
jgi:iron complex outermembrane receptor protein